MNKVSGEVVYLESKMEENSPIKGDSPSRGRQMLKERTAGSDSLWNVIYLSEIFVMKKLRFKSEFKNITDTDNWINFHEKNKCVIFFSLFILISPSSQSLAYF